MKTYIEKELPPKFEKVKRASGLNRATSEAAKPPICRQKPGYVYTVL
jgi:hypothetical protein